MRLASQETLSRSGAGGGAAVFIGVLLLAIGGGVVGIGTGVIPVDPSDIHAPMWVLTAFGAMFALPGIALLTHGVRGSIAARRRKHELLRRPDEPWLADRDWDPRGESFTGTGRFLKSAAATGFLAVFLVPFNWWAFLSGEGPVMVKAIVGLFDLILLLVAYEAVRRFLAMLRYRRSEVLFDSFPFFLGEEMSLRFRRPAHSVFRKLRFTLQCVEERLETSGTGRNRSTRRVPHAIWREDVDLDEAAGAADPLGDHALRFDLPADRPGNRLGEAPPTYWQLLVKGEASGPDYEGRFLLPVYERPT